MERHRIMIIGSNVTTVQRVSSYCLKKNLEVFPYYGIPIVDDITLFAPHVVVLCLPIPENFQLCQIHQPYIFWSENKISEEQELEELEGLEGLEGLYICVQKALQTLY